MKFLSIFAFFYGLTSANVAGEVSADLGILSQGKAASGKREISGESSC